MLFVAKGGTRYVEGQGAKQPEARSLSGKMNGPMVVEYEAQEGDTLAGIALGFYGKASWDGKIASANRLSLKKPLRKGMVLKIAAPRMFPSRSEIAEKTRMLAAKKRRKGEPIRTSGREAPSPTATPLAPPMKVDWVPRPKVNKAFSPGEKLKFEIRALGILGGYASLEVGPYTTVSGRPCLTLTVRANSVFPLTGLFPVNDLQTSYFDSVDFLSWKFENNVHEGGYKARNLEIYDQLKHQVVRTHNDEPPEVLDIAAYSQDIISCFYYFRLLPFEEGKTYDIPTQSGGKNYHLFVQVGGRERITVQAGTFECLKVKPLIQQGTVFRNNEDIDLWVTDDERHIPVKIKSGIVIGSIDVDLLDATLPNIQK